MVTILGYKYNSPFPLIQTKRKDYRMMGNHAWKFPHTLSFISLGNIQLLSTNNGCGYSSTLECCIDFMVMIIGYNPPFYLILTERKDSGIIGNQV